MLSVCIPVYNVDVTKLVSDLHTQIQELNESIEIVLIDDASDIEIKSNNRLLKEYCKIIELETNVGRSKIRNLFVSECKHPSLLFLDCDSEIISSTFLAKYIQELDRLKPKVLFGGSIYSEQGPDKKYLLRWKTSINKESKSIQDRELNFNWGFKTNNFIIEKELLQKIAFNENLCGYGHEDTLFAFDLFRANVSVIQSDNSVLNAHLDTNHVYLKKTKEALANLVEVLKILNYDKEFIKHIPLLKTYFSLKKNGFLLILKPIFWCIKPTLFSYLKSGTFFVWMFDLYKLIEFSRIHSVK